MSVLSAVAMFASVFAPAIAVSSAEDPPPDPPPAEVPMFSCEGDVHATPAERTDFTARWLARLNGADPDFDLQTWVDTAGEPVPLPISDEIGFTAASRDTLTRGCLITGLSDALASSDPTYGMDTSVDPPQPLPVEMVKAALGMVVFHNDPITEPNPMEPGPIVDTPNPVADALAALGHGQLPSITVPTLSIPSVLGLVTPVSQVISDLLDFVRGLTLPQLPLLGSPLQLPGLPISLPDLLSLPSITDLLNLVRSILDSTSYTVCFEGAKTNGVKCQSTVLGLPMLLDVQGDNAPDLQAHLLPTVNPQFPTGVSILFSVDRLAPLLVGNPPPVPADVTASWDIPLAGARADVGFHSLFQPGLSLAKHSEVTATVKNLSDATQGNPDIAFVMKQTQPQARSQLIAGYSKLLRTGNVTSATESTTATLDFTPVPTNVNGNLKLQTTSAGANKTRYTTAVNTNIQTKLVMNLLRRYPGTPPGPCCPIQSVTALADKLPSSIGLDIINDSAENSWTVGYTGNTTVDHLNVQGADYPSMAAYNAPDATQTVSSFNADVTKVPTRVDVVAKLPKPKADPRVVDVSYKGSLVSDPDAIVTVPTVDLGTLERVDGDIQRTFTGHAEDVPGRIHVIADLRGDALNTPPGKNLDVDLKYASSSQAKNLAVGLFDKSGTGVTRLDGTLTSLPPFLNVKVGTHPTDNSVFFNAKANADAPDASAALGTATIKYAKNADLLVLTDGTNGTRPTTDQYAVVKGDKGADGVANTDDDSTAVEAKYTGLKLADVTMHDDGQKNGELDLHAKIVNDAARTMTARIEDPDGEVNAVVDKVPKEVVVDYHRRQTGTLDECAEPENTHEVVYDAIDPIDAAAVTIKGKLATGGYDPDNEVVLRVGKNPMTGIGPIPTHLELFADGNSKQVAYRAAAPVGRVAASILSASTAACDASKSAVSVDLRQVPTSFGVIIDPERLRFSALEDSTTPIDEVDLAEDQPVSVPLGSVALAFTDRPNGTVPAVPAVNRLSVTSDKRAGGGTAAEIRLAGVRRFALDLIHESAGDPDSPVKAVETDLQLAAALPGVSTYLDFIDEESSEAEVLGTLEITPDLELDIDLTEDQTRVVSDTGTGHLDVNLEIGLGPAGLVDDLDLGPDSARPIGLTMRDDANGVSKIGIFLIDAPSTLDLRLGRLTEETRNVFDTSGFLQFGDYYHGGLPSVLTIDIDLQHQEDASKDILVKAVLNAVPVGYDLKVLPIVTGPDGEDAPTDFEFVLLGDAPLGQVQMEVHAGVPKVDDPDCSACDLKLVGTISNLSPGFKFKLQSKSSTQHADQTDTEIDLDQLGADGLRDPASSIANVSLDVLMWQKELVVFPGQPELETVPQIQADLKQVPAHVNILMTGNGKQDSSFVKACDTTPNSLPTLDYRADANTPDTLDMNLRLDFAMTSDDMAHPDPDPPLLDVGATNLSRSIHFENTGDGKYKVSKLDSSAPKTEHLHLEVSRQTLGLLNWDFSPEGCGANIFDIGPFSLDTAGGIKFSLRTGIGLDITNFSTMEVSPGILVDVSGDYDNFGFQLRDPELVHHEIRPIGLELTVHIADGIEPTIPIFTTPGWFDTAPIDMDVDFIDLTVNQQADWLNINLLVPCDIDISWDDVDITSYHAHITTSPGLFATTTNGFTTTDTAKFLVLPEIGQIIGGFLEFLLNPFVVLFDQIFYGEGSFGAHMGCP